jgi:hypothetical protein
MILANDVAATIAALETMDFGRPLSDARRSVLVNMAFNLNGLLGFTHTLDAVRSGDYGATAHQMFRSKWGSQVGQRAIDLSGRMKNGAWIMNPIATKALGSIIRWALAGVAGALFVKHGIWSQSDAAQYVEAGTMGLLSLGFSLWEKYRSRLKLLTALTMPAGNTEANVEQAMKVLPSPSVLTAKDTVPLAPFALPNKGA